MFPGYPKQRDMWRKIQGVERVFTPAECAAIIAMFDETRAIKATIKETNSRDNMVRQSRVQWIYYTPETEALYKKLWALTQKVNEKIWQFQLSGFYDALQLTEYETGQFYTWHEDNMSPAHSTRKLSLVVQLSDPCQYSGGDLVVFPDEHASRAIGSVTFFPSFLTHRVTHVSSGTRYSLVAWTTGEPFR